MGSLRHMRLKAGRHWLHCEELQFESQPAQSPLEVETWRCRRPEQTVLKIRDRTLQDRPSYRLHQIVTSGEQTETVNPVGTIREATGLRVSTGKRT